MKIKLILTLLFTVIFCFETSASNSSKLLLNGTVVAEEAFYGHIYDSDKVHPYLLIVRIDEVFKGEINSKYILVNYYWRLKDDVRVEGAKYSQWKFQLYREKSCNSSIGKLQFVMFGRLGEITGMMPRFKRSQGITVEEIPFDESLPCYRLKRDGFSPVRSSRITEIKAPETDTEYYVLENERWLNFPETPLEIGLMPGGELYLRNSSEKQINGFRLACVSENKGGRLNIAAEMPDVTYKLKSKEKKWSINSTGSDDYMRELKTCYDKNAKLSVVRVNFDDGSVWQKN